jgi:hypothetical protein
MRIGCRSRFEFIELHLSAVFECNLRRFVRFRIVLSAKKSVANKMRNQSQQDMSSIQTETSRRRAFLICGARHAVPRRRASRMISPGIGAGRRDLDDMLNRRDAFGRFHEDARIPLYNPRRIETHVCRPDRHCRTLSRLPGLKGNAERQRHLSDELLGYPLRARRGQFKAAIEPFEKPRQESVDWPKEEIADDGAGTERTGPDKPRLPGRLLTIRTSSRARQHRVGLVIADDAFGIRVESEGATEPD